LHDAPGIMRLVAVADLTLENRLLKKA